MRVELYADPIDGKDPVRREMTPDRQQPVRKGETLYRARVPSHRPAKDYTARVIPRFEGASVPLEAPRILWQSNECTEKGGVNMGNKIREKIAKAAYDIYEKSGRVQGKDLQNWLMAEKAVLSSRAAGQNRGRAASSRPAQNTERRGSLWRAAIPASQVIGGSYFAALSRLSSDLNDGGEQPDLRTEEEWSQGSS